MKVTDSFLLDLITDMIDGKLNYAEALDKLHQRSPQSEEEEDEMDGAEVKLLKVRDKLGIARGERKRGFDEENEHSIYPLEAIPNEWYPELLDEARDMISGGSYSEDIIEKFMLDYGLSYQLSAFINNEALHEARLKSLTMDEFRAVGNAYIQQVQESVMKQAEEEIAEVPEIEIEN